MPFKLRSAGVYGLRLRVLVVRACQVALARIDIHSSMLQLFYRSCRLSYSGKIKYFGLKAFIRRYGYFSKFGSPVRYPISSIDAPSGGYGTCNLGTALDPSTCLNRSPEAYS